MTATGSAPADRTVNGPASRRCPLCGCDDPRAAGASISQRCAGCGFDFAQLNAARRNSLRDADGSKKHGVESSARDPLDRWLAGETIEPKQRSEWDHVTQWLRWHPGWSHLIAAALIAAVLIPLVSLVMYCRSTQALQVAMTDHANIDAAHAKLEVAYSQKVEEIKQYEIRWQRVNREKDELEASLRRLHACYDQSQQQCIAADQRLQDALRDARLSMAEDFTRQAEKLQQGMPELSLVLAAKALSITQQEGVPPIPTAFQQVHDLLAPTDGVELRGHDGPVALLAASPNGNWLASGDHQGLVRLWNTAGRKASDRPRLLDGHWGRITQLAFTADNRWLVSASTDSTAHLWDLESKDERITPILLKNNRGRIVALSTSDNGRWLAIANAGQLNNDVAVRLWNLGAPDVPNAFVDLPIYQGQMCSLALNRDGDWVATGNEDGAVRLWRLSNQTGAVVGTDLRMHNEPVRAIRFATDGRSLVTAAGRQTGKGTIRAWNLDNNDAKADEVLADSPNGVELFAMTSDGRWLFTANGEPSLRVRDLATNGPQDDGKPLVGQTSAVQAIALSANERWLATAGTDNTIRLWYLGVKGPAATPITIRTPHGLVTSVVFAGKGDWLATGNDRGNIQMWNLRVDDLVRMANVQLLR